MANSKAHKMIMTWTYKENISVDIKLIIHQQCFTIIISMNVVRIIYSIKKHIQSFQQQYKFTTVFHMHMINLTVGYYSTNLLILS